MSKLSGPVAQRCGGDIKAPHDVMVPFQDAPLVAVPAERVRALRQHLLMVMRDLRTAKRPDRLIRPTLPEPRGFVARVLRSGCALCRGACCTGGDTHAYLDERTLARVRRDRPDLGVQAILRLYHASIAAVTFEGSCVFHGAAGCTLPRMLRSDLCNSFYCKGLQSVVQAGSAASAVSITASDGAVAGRSAILHRSVRG